VRRLAVLATLPTAVLALAGAPAAAAPPAAFVRIDGDLRYDAAPGQVNRPVVTTTITTSGTVKTYAYRVDDVVPLDPGAGCSRPDAIDETVVTCTTARAVDEPYPPFEIFLLGDGDDTMKGPGGDNPHLQILGEAGNDAIQADRGLLDGGDGDDTMIGPAAARDYRGNNFFNRTPRVKAGNGDDWIMGSAGADRIEVGGGHNVVFAAGGDDLVSGDDGSNEIDGGAGADQLRGGTLADVIHGGTGDDRIWGYGGNDRLYGDAGADRLLGGPGTDVMRGGAGSDRCYQVTGKDRCYQD
jgi:serralysin